jgi:hypothetical protein
VSTLVHSPSTGLEYVQRQALVCLIRELNDEILIVQEAWNSSDEEMAEMREMDYVATILEPVDLQDFHEGHRPSLISAPIERYPNVSVMCNRANPAAGSEQYDHMNVYRDALYVDIMVKAQPTSDDQEHLNEAEELVNRRVKRMADAVNSVLVRNRTLNGAVGGYDADPTITIGDVFTRKERTAYGQHWYWQGARLEYAVRKESALPSSTGSSYLTADIDQN